MESMTSQRSEKCIGILTSGGDAQGMNAAVRATTRMAIYYGMKVFGIKDGYQGLVDGGSCIKELKWFDVSGIMHRGGTMLGTARCAEFRERAGRLKAAKNLIQFKINNLVVIGGDGSLTGADIFKKEWQGLLEELVKNKSVTAVETKDFGYLNIVGMVGSIDNDMHGTDMTIGTDSALHRIIDSVDCIMSTADSHQRSFVVEVMGRHCGYLALMSGIAGAADWVLVPEHPPKANWKEVMCEELKMGREYGRRMGLVIVAEGAIDVEGNPIKAEDVRDVLVKKLNHDVRITVLGHLQRGGNPSAYDRILGCRMGAEAALTLSNANEEIAPKLIGVECNKIVVGPLMEKVSKTLSINEAMKEKDYSHVLQLRSTWFNQNLKMFRMLNCVVPAGCSSRRAKEMFASEHKFRFAVLNVGAPACGMNSAIYTFTRLLLYRGHTVLHVDNGIEGLEKGDVHVREVKWIDVDGWNSSGGSKIKTNRTLPTEKSLPKIVENLKKFNIQGLYLVGGFEGYKSLIILEEARKKYPELRIPLIGTPATISNNVPGSDYSLGSDTALNIIVNCCDMIKQSATANRKRVFIIETMGGYCGYLATMGGLAAGADAAYINEESFTVNDLQEDVRHLMEKFNGGVERGLVLRNEKCSEQLDTNFIVKLFQSVGEDVLQSRSIILGHLQQGGNPSPYDRIHGAKISSKVVEKIIQFATENLKENGTVDTGESSETACIVGITGKNYSYTSLQDLQKATDFKLRRPKDQWWMSLRILLRNLAKHGETIFKGEKKTSNASIPPDEHTTSGAKQEPKK